MRHLASFLPLFAVACGLDRDPLIATAPDGDVVLEAAAVDARPTSALPDSLRCVSDVLPGTEGEPQVMRVELGRATDGTFTAWITSGPQFWHRGGAFFGADGAAWPTTAEHTMLASGKTGLVAHLPSGDLSIELERDGVAFTGSLVDDACYVHTEAPLTCWNDFELFGSAWTGVPGLLPATFDWTSGTCKDASGAAALNDIPVAIVRETGFGQCADLRGADLNDGDFGVPELDGWNLAGADLTGATLFFANLNFATLNGANLSGLTFGYATVSGSFDDVTELPEDAGCAVTENSWGGSTVSCTR